jgi:hypothetical protein
LSSDKKEEIDEDDAESDDENQSNERNEDRKYEDHLFLQQDEAIVQNNSRPNNADHISDSTANTSFISTRRLTSSNNPQVLLTEWVNGGIYVDDKTHIKLDEG